MTGFLTDLFSFGNLSPVDFLKMSGVYDRVVTILVLITLIASLMLCYFGYRMIRVWMTFLGFICGFSLGAAVLGIFMTERLWYYYAGAVVIGIIVAILAYNIYLVGVFLMCGAVAAITVYGLLAAFDLPEILPQLITILSFVLFGTLAVRFSKPVIILATSCAGAYYAVRALVRLVDPLAASEAYRMIALGSICASGILLQFLMSHGKK